MPRERNAPRIKWSLFASFTAFTVIIMILIGVLQFLLLKTVYGWTTQNRMRSLLYELALDVQEEDFDFTVVSKAEEAGTALVVYRVSEEGFTLVAEAVEVNGLSAQFTAADVNELYLKTCKEKGILQEQGEELFGNRVRPGDPEHKRLISAYVTRTPAGETYFIVLDTDFLDGVEINCHPLYGNSYSKELMEIAEKERLIVTCGFQGLCHCRGVTAFIELIGDR